MWRGCLDLLLFPCKIFGTCLSNTKHLCLLTCVVDKQITQIKPYSFKYTTNTVDCEHYQLS